MILIALRKTGHADLQSVDVHVADGLVRLSGTVSSYFSKQTAQVVSAAAADSRHIDNAISVA